MGDQPLSIVGWLMALEVVAGLSIPSIPSGESFHPEHIILKFSLSEKYQKEFAPRLQKEHSDRFANKFVAFRTLLEVV